MKGPKWLGPLSVGRDDVDANGSCAARTVSLAGGRIVAGGAFLTDNIT